MQVWNTVSCYGQILHSLPILKLNFAWHKVDENGSAMEISITFHSTLEQCVSTEIMLANVALKSLSPHQLVKLHGNPLSMWFDDKFVLDEKQTWWVIKEGLWPPSLIKRLDKRKAPVSQHGLEAVLSPVMWPFSSFGPALTFPRRWLKSSALETVMQHTAGLQYTGLVFKLKGMARVMSHYVKKKPASGYRCVWNVVLYEGQEFSDVPTLLTQEE